MTEPLILRQETPEDVKEIFEVNRLAFGQENEAKLVDALRNNPAVFVPGLSIVAAENGRIVGHILFTKISIQDDEGNRSESLGLAPMAVKPEFQSRGIGGELIRKGLEVAKRLNFESVFVLGHKHYYPKFGFESTQKWNIKAPFDVPSDVFMAIELKQDGLKNKSGTVVYPKEFDAM